MNVLLIYPQYPLTFWSFKHTLKIINKKSSFPPLGLLTIASLLPDKWNLKLIDLNVTNLKDENIQWADLVIISAMSIQKDSTNEVIERCKSFNVKIAGGGPLFNVEPEKFYDNIDYLILGEGEITIKEFVKDIENEKPKNIYSTTQFADMTKSPVPKWELIENINDYASLSLQYSRGCPFNCEFCNVTSLFGRKIRTKTTKQIIEELNRIYKLGWKGGVFFVDDNFIAAKKRVKKELLPAIIEWMKKRNYPFEFFTQTSIDLSDDDEMIDLMVKAGFDTVFVGIETPNEESLIEVKKYQNVNRNLLNSVKKLHKKGLQVQAGFIIGFDNDPPDIFNRQINFIQKSGIMTAMVGLLIAAPGTKLYEKLKKENRLLNYFIGNNTDLAINFIPKMDLNKLIQGYIKVVTTIYSPDFYYKRLIRFLKDYTPKNITNFEFSFEKVKIFFKILLKLGIKEKERIHFWKTLCWIFFHKIRCLPIALHISVTGYHFRKTFEELKIKAQNLSFNNLHN